MANDLMPDHPAPLNLEPLPDVASLIDRVPDMASWSTVDSAESLFQALRLDQQCPTDNLLRRSAHDTWMTLLPTEPFRRVCQPLLKHLAWYGSDPAEQPSPRISQALLGRAIIERFCLGAASSGFLEQLFPDRDITQYNHAGLLEAVGEQLAQRNAGAGAPVLEMLKYLLLRELAPELLVDGVSDHFCYGRSLQSVALIHSARFLQAVAPGGVQRLNAADLVATGQFLAQSGDPGVQLAWNKAMVIAALRYAAAHRAVVVDQGIDRAGQAQINQALAYLKTEQDAHAQEMQRLLSIKPPDRRALAHRLLKDAKVPAFLWPQGVLVEHWPVLQEHGLSIAGSYGWDHWISAGLGATREATVEELVMMGEVYQAGQPTVPERYAQQFSRFKESLIAAKAAVIQRLLAEMPDADQAALAASTCEVSRVSFAAEQGRHGIFIRCEPGDRRADFHDHAQLSENFFEVIPAAGVARRISSRFEYRVDDSGATGVISIQQAWRHHEEHQRRETQAEVTPLVDLDSDAYLHGAVSRSAKALRHPRRGELQPAPVLIFVADGNVRNMGESLARAAAEHLLAPTLDELQTQTLHQTAWEQQWAHERQVADTVARLLVPFYGCIADLRQGNHSAGVLFNCALDAVATLVPMGQFLRSTAIVLLRAGELSVLSMADSLGKVLGRLTVDIFRQTTALGFIDLLKPGLRLTRSLWEGLFVAVPALKQAIGRSELLFDRVALSKGFYRVPVNYNLSNEGVRALVDGLPDVPVRNVGSEGAADYRALDPCSGHPYDRRLTAISEAAGIELSSAERIGPGHYPPVIPVRGVEEGVHEVRIDQGCRIRLIDQREGVFDILVDDTLYRLDSRASNAALRRLDVAPLPAREQRFKAIEILCRPKRDLEEVACDGGTKLVSEAPQLLDEARERMGVNISWAFEGREFRFARFTGVDETLDVLVHDGKACKWAQAPGPSSRAAGKKLIPLTEEECLDFSVPDVFLRDRFGGRLSSQIRLGFRSDFEFDEHLVNEDVPVIEISSIADGISDARTLRGIRLTVHPGNPRGIPPHDVIVVEADTGVFYWARKPHRSDDARLSFSRLNSEDRYHREMIDRYLTLSDQYRIVRGGPDAIAMRDKLAHLLFEMRVPIPRGVFFFKRAPGLELFELFNQQLNNWFNDAAAAILTGSMEQQAYVEMAREFIGDFKHLTERTVDEQQAIIDVLNKLLPVQDFKGEWVKFSLENIALPATHKIMSDHIKGGNLAFICAVTEGDERLVYYALSGGKNRKNLKLRPETRTGNNINRLDGIPYHDARALNRADPEFISLPVTRDADNLRIISFPRDRDSERLVATAFKDDMARKPGRRLKRIDVFTLLDTCNSCGGFVLPRLKLDFPNVPFSVTWLKEYVARST